MYVFGDNSVFKQASEAKLKTDIANWQERLEMAKSPVFIEGLGTFEPDKYFDYIQGKDIINNKDTDVIDNGDGTYDVTTKPGYVFLVTLMPTPEKPTDAEIEYLGQVGKLQPKIKEIRILETTKSSFKIQVSARLEGAEIKCYYKAKANVATGETESDITGYTQISLDSGLIGSVTSGLTAGTIYKVKVILTKNEEIIGTVSKEVTTTILVTNVTLNKTAITIDVGKSEVLRATVLPEDAENKELEWKSNKPDIATIDQNGKITGVSVGTATITVKAKDGSNKNSSCTVKVEQAESNWAEIAEIAKLIATGKAKTKDEEAVDYRSNEAVVTLNGEQKIIEVGQEFYAKHNGIARKVRVMGFNHDTLTNKYAYGSGTTAQKAGISFEFVEFMIDESKKMNTDAINTGGWPATEMRTFLEGAEGIGKLSETLKSNIKQVNKVYIKEPQKTETGTSKDKLWLLSCSEILEGHGSAVTEEGNQYQVYVKTGATGTNAKIFKFTTGLSMSWYLRSPWNSWGGDCFCFVDPLGGSGGGLKANAGGGVAPGFGI